MENAFYFEEFANLTKAEKKLTQILFDHEIRYKKGQYDRVRLKRETLAAYAKCCIKTVSRFNEKVKLYLIGIIKRWKANGNQGANEYAMDVEFFKALKVLYDNNLLYKSKSAILKFSNSHRQNENVSLCPKKCPSSYSPSSFLGIKEYGSVHSYIQKIGGLTHRERQSLSQYPEHAIVAGVDDCVWYSNGHTISNLMALLTSRIRKRANL